MTPQGADRYIDRMNWVDLIVVAIFAISALLAFMRGFVREVLGIGAWVGAAFIAWWAFPYAQPKARLWIESPQFADIAAYVAVFIVALILLSIVAGLIGGVVRGSLLGGIDRTLGIVFGLLRGAAIVAAAYVALATVVPPDRWPQPLLEARTIPYAYQGAVWAAGFVPDLYRPPIKPPPAGAETRAEDLFQPPPQGRAIGRPANAPL